MRAADLRRLRGEADAAWRAEVEGEAGRVLALPDPAGRMRAYAELSRVLAEEGEALPPAVTDRIFRSLRADAETAEREERRRRWEAERAAAARLDLLRPWALGFGVPSAAALPGFAAAALADWSLLDVFAVLPDLPSLPAPPLALCGLAWASVSGAAWLAATARSVRSLAWCLCSAGAAGLLLVAGAHLLPVYRAAPGTPLADGSSLSGAVVRVERLWPRRPDRLHVVRGNARVGRGAVLELHGGEPVRYLRGG